MASMMKSCVPGSVGVERKHDTDRAPRFATRASSCTLVEELPVLQQVADLDEQLLLGGQGLLLRLVDARLGGLALLPGVHRVDEHEVDDERRHEERDDGSDEVADREGDVAVEPGHREADVPARVGLHEQGQDRVDHGLDDRVHQGAERTADDDRDSQIDDVSAEDELFEPLDHVHAPLVEYQEPADGGEDFASDFDDVGAGALAPPPAPELPARESVR